MSEMLDEAIGKANSYAKKVDLKVKYPPKASIMELKYQEENLELNMEAMTRVGLWCLPGSITYLESSKLMYLRDKNIAMLETFGKCSVFPGSV
jgi:hypothetical protein